MPTDLRPFELPESANDPVTRLQPDEEASASLTLRELDTLLERAERDPALLPPFLSRVIEGTIREAIATGHHGRPGGALEKVTVVASQRACLVDLGGVSYLLELGVSQASGGLEASVRGLARRFEDRD